MVPRLLATAAVFALSATVATAQAPQTTADLKNGSGQVVGKVTLVEAPKGVLLKVEAKGLTPGWHGLHFHEKGDCGAPDFKSAGAHVHTTTTVVHGLLNPDGNDNGDLPNLYAAAEDRKSTRLNSSHRT